MARIYLISPPYHDVYKKINYKNFGVLQPPLGLAYIASYVKSRGHAVKIIDTSFCNDIFQDIKRDIAEFKPDFVGISATTPQITGALKIAELVKTFAPAIKIILGGYHVSALPKEYAAHPHVDYVVCGEGEITVSEILEGKNPDDVKGICFQDNGKIKVNPPRPLIEDLDALPFPLWEQLPVRSYYYFPQKNIIGLISGRGCPYHCSFCASAVINQRRYRMRSPANFVDELGWVYKNFGVQNFFFVDETFTINLKRTEEICNLILEKKAPVKWTCDTRVDHLTKPILRTMKSAGCQMLRIGVESADEKVLKATGKGITLEQVERVVTWSRELGIKTTAFFLLGLPHETPESLKKTLLFSRTLRTDLSHFTMHVPLPGTQTWDIATEGKILRCAAKDWNEYIRYDNAIVESDDLSADQLQAYHRLMVRSYYLNPLYMLQTLCGIKSFKELGELTRGGVTLFKMITQKKNG